jgi:hypothetical protein
MPKVMEFIPDVPGAGHAKIVRQGSVEEPLEGFLITTVRGGEAQRGPVCCVAYILYRT